MSDNTIDPEIKKVAFIGNYLPRQCGIATFTTDLCESVSALMLERPCYSIAMNDTPEGYTYPSRVKFEIEANRREQYANAGAYINLSQPSVVCVQHEYGIFGGKAGRHILHLLRQIRVPIVTTLHTVLKDPDQDQLQVLRVLGDLSDRLVVMSRRAVEFLKDIYGIPERKIALIHHGIPDTPFLDPNYYKDKFQVEGCQLLLSFGLLGPAKGLEYVIEAMASVVKEYPNAHYIILGATHPHVRRDKGEEYRQLLLRKVGENNLSDNVSFVNRFVTLEELCEYLGAADIYITPYLNESQITSGTLAYAMGFGKAVVSTPYWYAEEMLADQRGRLVPFRDANAIAGTLLDLLRNETERHAMRKRAYQHCRSMIWREVAREYLNLFAQVRRERHENPRSVRHLGLGAGRFDILPEINIRHLTAMTDSTGIFQHAHFSVPDPRYGYSTDDQARALIVAIKAARFRPEMTDWETLVSRYLAYLVYAFDEESRRFGNFMSYQRTWTKPVATEDVHARAVWSLAHVVAYSSNRGYCATAAHLMDRAIAPTVSFSSPRAWAYAILAIQTYLRKYPGATAYRKEREILANRLFEQTTRNASDDWPWPEDCLTYANARVPQALIEAGQWLQNSNMANCGLRALEWLDRLQTSDRGHFSPIGSNGWYPRGGIRARFDQQPIEASGFLDACIAAYRLTGANKWLSAAYRSFEWFLGRNDLGLPLYDYSSGACYDGLHLDRVNENQGAESTVCWLLSLLSMYEIQDEINIQSEKTEPAGK
ncbi:MAG: glycosyltransferase family 4 protein [Planctomycetes bacterium]|nr:glycosyltransferase family 4 protein [Planctomycetota bacterium]